MADVVPNDTQEPMVNGDAKQATPPPQEELTEMEVLEKESQRPANIKADMKDMERNRRVSLILNSQAFREELEAIVESQLKTGPHPASLLALQQITDLILPHSRFNQSSGSRAGSYTHHVTPVADIRGVDSQNYTKGEKLMRCKLASLYRLLDLHGWTQLIYNHISVRVSHDQNHFLINPFGLMYHEVSASSLIKIDNVGNIIDHGTSTYGPNLAGFTLHSAIHAARPDIRCVIHVHTPSAAAVSSMKCGLLPISQESLIVGEVSYMDYTGILVEEEDKDKVIRSLGPNNKVMFLRNHGVVCCGASIEEAYFYLFTVMAACEIQVKSMAAGMDNLVLLPEEMRKKTHEFAVRGSGGVGDTKKWKVGELEFEAMMRQLDNMGYKTGYIYHQPVVQHEPKPRSEVAHPPISTNFTYVYDDDVDGSKYVSPLKLANKRQQKEKTKWLNTPNQYTKMEVTIQEDGDSSPKTKTKWITSEDGTCGDSIVIQDPQQFAKQGDNPKEFKNKRKELKNDFYDDKKSAGPISEVLSGVTWQKPPQQGNPSSDNVKAASKGIIQRDYQQDAVLYTSYTPNPFDKMTEKDILQYKKEIAEKTGQDVKEIELIVQEVDDATVVNNVSRVEGPEGQEVTVVTESLKIETTIDGNRSEDASSAAEDAVEKSTSDVEVSPSKENASPSKKGKKKFRTPSFLKKKKEKKEKAAAAEKAAAGF
ncbi:alpha-adducin-like isoform X2 [Antedon mediterranea]|uniref:alpha-adducin-like isoform X2 n=1 Tax=Antedon mediterranea TaxID=105859 RepID=UPI003AF58240